MSIIKAKASDFSRAKEIAAGGEGKIYEHPSDKTKVIKIYHQARSSKFKFHLETLSKLPKIFVTPIDIYVDVQDNVLGFSMNFINFNDYWLFNNLFNKGFCNSNSIDKAFKIKVLDKLETALNTLHQSDIIIGDLNQYNLFVSKNAEIVLVDTDSYGTLDNHHSGVLLDDIRDWTTTDINKQTDIYAFDVLAFWTTTYCHPYKWVVPGNKESLEMRTKSFKSILSSIPGIKIPPLYEAPIGEALKQFKEIFNMGRRYLISFTGSHVPVPMIVKQPVASSSLNIRELYKDITAINAANDYIALKNKNNHEWILLETKLLRVTRNIIELDCDVLFPSDNKYAYIKKNTLFSQDLTLTKSFSQPIFDYNNGSLSIIDYNNDNQWCYNINNQLIGIDGSMQVVFAKSMVKRSGVLQNFGLQKMLNVPIKNGSRLIQIPKGTKDAFYVKEYIGCEYTEKNQVKYAIIKPNTVFSNYKYLFFDHLPYFAVTNTGVILVPEDGLIEAYDKEFNKIGQFDCPICSKDSKLYQTNAGLILHENNTVYLLNTK